MRRSRKEGFPSGKSARCARGRAGHSKKTYSANVAIPCALRISLTTARLVVTRHEFTRKRVGVPIGVRLAPSAESHVSVVEDAAGSVEKVHDDDRHQILPLPWRIPASSDQSLITQRRRFGKDGGNWQKAARARADVRRDGRGAEWRVLVSAGVGVVDVGVLEHLELIAACTRGRHRCLLMCCAAHVPCTGERAKGA